MFLFSNKINSQSLSSGLVGDYSFNGNTIDNSGFGNNAIVWGAIPIAGKAGIPNTAYHFDGTTNYMEVPDANSLDLDTAITIYVVFKAEGYYTGPCQGNTLISKWTTANGGTGYGALFTDNVVDYNCSAFDSTKDIFMGSAGNNNWNQGLYDYHEYIRSNTWYCAAFTQDADTQRIFLDGVLKSANYVPNNIGVNSVPLWFAKNSNGVPSFKGIIDEIKIYNRALSKTEIANLYFSTQCNGVQSAKISSFGNRTFCEGSDVLLSLSSNLTGNYIWKKNGVPISGANNRNYLGIESGTYTCVVMSGCGSFRSNSISISRLDNVANTISTQGSTTFCAGDSLILQSSNVNSGYTYQWYRGNSSINGANTSSLAAKNPGTYQVITTNISTNCSRISTNNIIANVNCRMSNPDRITEVIESVPNLLIYPNPNSGSFTIDFSNSEMQDSKANIFVVDMLGKTIYSEGTELRDGKLSKEIYLPENLINGIYLVNLSLNGKLISSKVILQ